MAPIIIELDKRNIDYTFISTGQHKKSLYELIDVFHIRQPEIVLYNGKEVTKITDTFFWLTTCVLKIIYYKITNSLFKNKGFVLIHGDTLSTLLGAIIGKIFYQKVVHIESGLRSYNYFNPFPEEITRVLTFYLTDVFFCPGHWATNNVHRYGRNNIDTIYNTLIDTLKYAIDYMNNEKVNIPSEKFALVSIHRFENIQSKSVLIKIVNQIINISKRIKTIFIIHSPTEYYLKKYHLFTFIKNTNQIEIRQRYNYPAFIKLLSNCEYLITDGGSNQEECFYLGKPCLLFRNCTERKEGLGKNVLLSRFNSILINQFIQNYSEYKTSRIIPNQRPTDLIINYMRSYKY